MQGVDRADVRDVPGAHINSAPACAGDLGKGVQIRQNNCGAENLAFQRFAIPGL
jgi:hypothetical protein